MKKRALRVLVGLVAGVALLWWWASVDRCPWEKSAPSLTGLLRARGQLSAGAAKVPVEIPLPVVVGGYGPPRSEATGAQGAPISARALHVEVGGSPFAVVVLDLLLIPPALADAVRAGRSYPVWVLATHTHSSLGGYDARWGPQLAALGRYQPARFDALVKAAGAALDQAKASAVPATVEQVEATVGGLSTPRSGTTVDERLTRARFATADGKPIALWLIFSAHPTILDRRTVLLDADWPGRVCTAFEVDGAVTLVTQGAGGNATARLEESEAADGYAHRFADAVQGQPAGAPQAQVELALASVRMGLPRPDASRLVPGPLRAAAENVLCEGAPNTVEVQALRLGPLALLAVPVEPTFEAGRRLETQAGAQRVVGLANGYSGYLDTEEMVRAQRGEAARQYFGGELLGLLEDGAALAGIAAGLRAR